MTEKIEKTDLVWLPESLAKKLKEVQDDKLIEDMILEYINETKTYLQTDIKNFEDEVLIYRGSMIKAKQAFKEAKDEQLNAMYALWEKSEKDIEQIRDLVGKAKKELEPLKKELDEIKILMSSIDKFGIQNLLEIIKELNSHYYGETKDIINFLFKNYKREK